MKKLAKLSPGRIFNFAGEKFVVMEQRDGAAFVLLAQSKESCPFNDKDDAENRNDYTRSTLKERIDKWVEALPRTSEEAAAILPFEVDLSCTDRSKSYYASYSVGIRPALLLNSDLLVSLDDEVEDDCCGECDCCGGKGLPSLDGISTATLLEEIQRRAMRAGSVFMGEDGTDE